MTYPEDNAILGEAQGAFRKDRLTEDHIFTFKGFAPFVCLKIVNLNLLSLMYRTHSIEFGVMACFIYYGRVEYNASIGSCLDHFIVMSQTKFCLMILNFSSRLLSKAGVCPISNSVFCSNERLKDMLKKPRNMGIIYNKTFR